MFDLIDREALKKEYCDCCAISPDCMGSDCKIYNARCLLKDLPTLDAEPVKHGRWINDTFCSECNRFPVPAGVSVSDQELTKYFSWCPHCGAKMDGGANNDCM